MATGHGTDIGELLNILSEIAMERRRQDIKWGVQNHPSLHPVAVSHEAFIPPTEFYRLPTAGRAKAKCNEDATDGNTNWTAIAMEEFCEAVEADTPLEMRQELVQLGAVVVAWIECLDRAYAAQIQAGIDIDAQAGEA